MPLMRGGSVAENSTVCRSTGVAWRIASMSSAKPMSSISSASSSTTTSIAAERQRATPDVVERPTGRGDDDMRRRAPARRAAAGWAARRRSARRGHRARGRSWAIASETCIASSRVGHQDQGHRRRPPAAANALENRQREGGRLAGAGGGLAEQIPALQQQRNRLALDRRRLFVPEAGEDAQQLGPQSERSKPVGRVRDGLCHRIGGEGGESGTVQKGSPYTVLGRLRRCPPKGRDRGPQRTRMTTKRS